MQGETRPCTLEHGTPDPRLCRRPRACSPQVMTSYKYKVKVIPGTLKKGKAVRQAAELMLKGPEVTQRERDLIR